MKWSFPSNNRGEILGIGHSGVETFQGKPIKSLAREICQNSLDAALGGQTAKVEFMPFVIDIDEFPAAESLRDAFVSSFEFWSVQSEQRAREFFERAIQLIDSRTIPFLRISDFNTSGLQGSRAEYNTPWCNLTKSSGSSDKSGTSGGSFGIGKFAPFSCSEFRTVFYSTVDIDGETASQGISRITSFRRKEDGEITAGIGYYGADNNRPFYSQLSLDPEFSRPEGLTGTDVYIAGFRFFYTEWKDSVVASVLDGFLYAVFTEKLVVKVDNIIIDKQTLPELILKYQNSLEENADKYFKVLSSQDTTWYETDFRNMGLIRLGLLIQSEHDKLEMHRKVAMIRKTGMKIMDRGNISGITPFAGVLIIEGEMINRFLRNLENPQHTKWEPERMEPPTRIPLAREVLLGLRNYIRTCLEELKQSNPITEIDPDVGQYLPDVSAVDDAVESTDLESLSDTIEGIDVTIPPRIKSSSAGSSGVELINVDREDGDNAEDDEGVDLGDTGGEGSSGGSGGGGTNVGKSRKHPTVKRRGLVRVMPSKTRVVCLDKDEGKYSVTFVPLVSAKNGYFELFLSAETQNYAAPIVSVKDMGHADLIVEGNKIKGLEFVANKSTVLLVTIDHNDYCSMEVNAYGYTG